MRFSNFKMMSKSCKTRRSKKSKKILISIQLTHWNFANRICFWQELQVLCSPSARSTWVLQKPSERHQAAKMDSRIHLNENYWKVFVLFDTFEDWNILENVSGLQSCAFCGRLGGSWSNKRTSLKADPDSSNYWLCYKSAAKSKK